MIPVGVEFHENTDNFHWKSSRHWEALVYKYVECDFLCSDFNKIAVYDWKMTKKSSVHPTVVYIKKVWTCFLFVVTKPNHALNHVVDGHFAVAIVGYLDTFENIFKVPNYTNLQTTSNYPKNSIIFSSQSCSFKSCVVWWLSCRMCCVFYRF